MEEKLEDVFSRLSRKPKDLLAELKGLWLGNEEKELPQELLTRGLTSKLLTGLHGHLVRELKRRNSEYVFVLLRSFHSILKYQVDEMEAEPSSGVLDRAADMIVFTFNKVASEPSVQKQWAEIINLLASSASLLAVYQPKGLGGCMTVLMELSQHQNLEVDCRVKVCNAINELWEVYSVQIKEGTEAKGRLEDHCKRWLVSLGKAGDYELQLQLLEAVFRVSDAKQRDLLAKMCFKDHQLATEFKNINPKELDVGSRRFLNFLNRVEGSQSSVSSIPCLLYQFGDIQLPCPPEIDQFWVDFNFGGQSMSTYIEDSWEGSPGSSEDAPWISVVVKNTNVASYKLQAATETIVLELTLKQAAGTLVPTCPIRNDSTLLRLSFHGAHYDQLSLSMEKVFGRVTLFSPRVALSTTSEGSAVQKRKVSQAPVHVLISSKRSYTPVCIVNPGNKQRTPAAADKALSCNGTPAPEEASVQAGLPSNRTTADTVMSETRVSGDKEGKAPSVPVSPIYSSPVKSHKFAGNSAGLDTTPHGRNVPSCTPKTSTPRKQSHISALLTRKESNARQTRLRKRGQPQQQLNEAGGTPPNRGEVQASQRKIVPPDVGVRKTLHQGDPTDSTHQTSTTEQQCGANEHSSPEGAANPTLQKAETRSSREQRRQLVTEQESQPTTKEKVPSKRPALENITNVARDKGKKAPPPKKTKTAKGTASRGIHVNALASEAIIDLDVIQDSIPQGIEQKGRTTKQTTAKRRNSKDKQAGWQKHRKSPLSRSLIQNPSANISKCSSTMDKDPYAFDSEDEVPDLLVDKPAGGKGRRNTGSKWHEAQEEQPSQRKEKIRVYSNKGKAQHSFCLSVSGDSTTMSLNDSLENSPPPVKPSRVDKPAGAAVVGYKGGNKGLTRQKTSLCTKEPLKKPHLQVTKGCRRTRNQPSFSVPAEESFNSHCDDSDDESYLPKGKKPTLEKETVKTAAHKQPSSSSRERPQRSCRRSSELSSKGSANHVQPVTPAHSLGSEHEDEPGSGAVEQPYTKTTTALKITMPVSASSSRKRKVEVPVRVTPRQVQERGIRGEPFHRAQKGIDRGAFQPPQATPLQEQEGQVEVSPILSSGQEDEALAKEVASPLCGYEDEGISEVVASLPYHTCPKDRGKMPRVVLNEQLYVGSSPTKPTELEEYDNRKHSEALQVSSPSLEEADNYMEASEPEQEVEEEVDPDVRELTLEFAAICKDVIAHSGTNNKKGARGTAATKNATKQKGRKRVGLSKGESTVSKRKKDETPAFKRPQRGRVQSAKRTPHLPPPTPATEKAGCSHLMYTNTAKSGRGSYKCQTPQRRHSGKGGKRQASPRAELSPLRPIQFPSLESHSTCSSPHEDSEDEVPSQPGISTQVQETLQPLAAVMQAKSASYQGSAHQVAQKACKSTEKQTAQFWRLQTEKWGALRQHFSSDLLPLVSDIEEDALGTCQAVENMQKLMCAFGDEHKTLMSSLSSQNGRLSDLSGAHRNLKKQWSASERDFSKTTAALEGNIQKEVEHITKEAMAKSRQEQMDKIRRSVQTWLLFNM